MRAAYMDGMDRQADKYGFILIVPQGSGEVKLGHLRGKWNGGKWQGGECCGDADDVGFISKAIDDVKNRFNIDASRIYATGISNGGLMVNRLACELSGKIAAIATVAPAAIESSCNPLRPVPVMDIHGTADPANPPDGSEPRGIFNEESGSNFAMAYKRMTPYEVVGVWKRINKCSDSRIKGYEKGSAHCVIYNECAGGAEVELCMVGGMGHTYPGGSQYLPAVLVGPVSYDISFDQIWEFFMRHPMADSPIAPSAYSPGDYKFFIRHDGISRFYLIHVPSARKASEPQPLILAFHGGGGNSEMMANAADYYNLISKSEKEGFIIAFPNGASRFRYGKFATWNAGNCCGYARDNNIDDAGFVKDVIRDIKSKFDIDNKKVYALGFSNGGMFAYRLACDMPEEFRAIASVAGTDNCDNCNPGAPVSIMHIHAENDDRVLFEGGAGPNAFRDQAAVTDFTSVPQTIEKWVKRDNCGPAPKRVLEKEGVYCDLYSGCDGDTQVMLCVTKEGGHSWPGGKKPRERGGPPSNAISAVDVMWNFFKSQPTN